MDDGTYAYDDRLISSWDEVLPAFYWPLHGEQPVRIRMYHGTFHRWRESVIFDVAHAGRLLSATLAFWNIDKSKVVERVRIQSYPERGRIKNIFDSSTSNRIAKDKSFRPGLTWIFLRLIDYI